MIRLMNFTAITFKCLILLSVILFATKICASSPCEMLAQFGSVTVAYDHQEPSVEEYLAQENKRELQTSSFAKNIFDNYLIGLNVGEVIGSIDDCFSKEDVEAINSKLQTYIKEKSVSIIRTWGIRGEKFSDLVQANQSVINYSHEGSRDHKKKASFDRGRRNIFMNLTEIDYRDWLVIFVHEYVHALDETLKQNVAFFGNSTHVVQIDKLAKTPGLDEINISKDDYDLIYHWCLASFQRGILSEIRAWSITVALYLEARNNKKINKIAWMNDTFLDGDQTNELVWYQNINDNLAKKIYDKISPNFTTEYEKIFAVPVFRKITEKISIDINQNPKNYFSFDPKLRDVMALHD
jgi:hypothetical protein